MVMTWKYPILRRGYHGDYLVDSGFFCAGINTTPATTIKPRDDIPLFDTKANRLQLYHSPRAKILAFNNNNDNDNTHSYGTFVSEAIFGL